MPRRSRHPQSRLQLQGHALQPLLLMFPLGLLAVAIILDAFHAFGAPRLVGTLAYCTIVAALVGGTLTAAVTGVDALTAGHPAAVRQCARRLLTDLAVLTVFAVVVLVRLRQPDRTAPPGLLSIELLGLAAAVVSARLGGRLGEAPVATR
jgi:uncharacterized membrane protein